jgi:hypothetical protein
LGDAKTRCHPIFEASREPWIYKTPHHPDYKKDRHERMVRVALATTAAPTYFDAFENDGYRMIDGASGKYPVMNALVDAWRARDRATPGAYPEPRCGEEKRSP